MEFQINKELETKGDKERWIGKTFTSKNYGDFIVIGVYDDVKEEYVDKKYVIQFLNTKNKKIVDRKGLKTKQIADRKMNKFKIGDRFSSNGYGEYEIIDSKKVLRKDGTRNKTQFLIQFEEYNNVEYKKWCDIKEVANGSIKNPYYPKVYDIGYMGELDGENIDANIYAVWQQILNRCYNIKSKAYKNYGDKGITVCERWHNFTNFYKDYISIENYDKNARQDLDKDILQSDVPKSKQVYSPETCILISPSENSKEALERTRQSYFLAYDTNSNKFYISNHQGNFEKENNIKTGTVTNSLSRDRKYTGESGWKFRKLKELEIKNYVENKITPYDIKMTREKYREPQTYFIVKLPNGKEKIGFDQYKFADENNINKSSLFGVLNKYNYTHDKDGNRLYGRKLTPAEIELYLSKENHGIKFDSPIN